MGEREDVEALAEVLRRWTMNTHHWNTKAAEDILASDWLAAHVRARVAEALAPIEALADEWQAAVANAGRGNYAASLMETYLRDLRAALPAPDPREVRP